jgi:four helix bundle protein
MASIKRFEDLPVWQLSRKLSLKIYEATKVGTFSKDFSLKDQINDSSGSVMDNIAEGFERGGNREFIQFLGYSKGSAGETRSQLYRALDRKHIDESKFNELHDDAVSVSNMIGGFMNYLQGSNMRGSKFHEPEAPYGNPPEDEN